VTAAEVQALDAFFARGDNGDPFTRRWWDLLEDDGAGKQTGSRGVSYG
jgi:hypothetical protein